MLKGHPWGLSKCHIFLFVLFSLSFLNFAYIKNIHVLIRLVARSQIYILYYTIIYKSQSDSADNMTHFYYELVLEYNL